MKLEYLILKKQNNEIIDSLCVQTLKKNRLFHNIKQRETIPLV